MRQHRVLQGLISWRAGMPFGGSGSICMLRSVQSLSVYTGRVTQLHQEGGERGHLTKIGRHLRQYLRARQLGGRAHGSNILQAPALPRQHRYVQVTFTACFAAVTDREMRYRNRHSGLMLMSFAACALVDKI